MDDINMSSPKIAKDIIPKIDHCLSIMLLTSCSTKQNKL